MTVIKFTIPQKIRHYKKQMQFITTPKRYTVVEATTKAGKTSGCLVWLYGEACEGGKKDNYWWVSPINATSKIAFRRLKRMIKPRRLFVANNSEMTITLANGATIFFKSADNPDSLYGDDVKAVVIDEASRTKKDTWTAVRSVITATGGKVKIIGNVRGIDNWVYEMARKAEAGELDDWDFFRITAKDAIEAGIFPQSEIDDAEKTLPREIFLELYYAIPFVNSSNKFAFSFDERKHVRKTQFNPGHPIYLSFDFNRNPICCTAFQHYDGRIRVIKVFKLPNSNIYRLCAAIKTKFPNALYIINGDATGQNLSAITQDEINYYTVIRKQLSVNAKRIQVPTVNPKIEDNQLLVNAILEHYPVDMDPDECAPLINDCKFVEMGADGKIKKGDRTDPNQQADAIDTFRYYLNTNFKWFLKNYMPKSAA